MTFSRKSLFTIICSVAMALVGGGCSTVKVRFVDAPADRVDLKRGRPIQGSSKRLYLFSIFPLGPDDRHVAAYEQLLKKAGKDYITDIRVTESWTYVYYGTIYGTTLTATAYPDLKDAPTPVPTNTLTSKLAELKTLLERGEVSLAEYEAARKRALEN